MSTCKFMCFLHIEQIRNLHVSPIWVLTSPKDTQMSNTIEMTQKLGEILPLGFFWLSVIPQNLTQIKPNTIIHHDSIIIKKICPKGHKHRLYNNNAKEKSQK